MREASVGVFSVCLVPVVLIALAVITSRLARPLIWRRRDSMFTALIPSLEGHVAAGRYGDALDFIEANRLLRHQYKLSYAQAEMVTKLEVQSLEALGRTEDALISLSGFLTMRCKVGQWPDDLLNKWLELYTLVKPLPIEKFYVCHDCGLELGTRELLRMAVSRGLAAPIGFTGNEECPREVNIFGISRR